MIRRATLGVLAAAIALCLHPLPMAHAETPLLQEGKSQLFQRVLLRSDMPRRARPDAAEGGTVARALDPYYVFERRTDLPEPWLRVAARRDGSRAFWVPEGQSMAWDQSIVLTFTTLGGTDRLLIFEDVDSVYDVVESEDPAADASELRRNALTAAAEGHALDGPVISVGPELGVDLASNFYMLPILESEEAVFERGGFVNLLRVAVAKAQSGALTGPVPSGAGRGSSGRDGAVRDFRAGIVFAVDTTRSMGVYFDDVREAVMGIFDRLDAAGAEGQLSFGLVGFRDAVVKPGIEYRAKTFVDLPEGRDRAAFRAGLAEMKEATASTRGFNEDSFSGVLHSLDQLTWDGIHARLVVLVTDAGPRLGTDPLSGTRTGARRLANMLKDRYDAHVATLHLRTDRGAHTHEMAEEHYSELSRVGQSDVLYFPVPGGGEQALRDKADVLAGSISAVIEQSRSGAEFDPESLVPTEISDENAEIARRTLRVVKSLQLNYLGREVSATAPDVFEGWIADRDFARPELQPVEIRLLVSRRDLSNLYESLQDIIAEGEEMEPRTFFQRLVAASAERVRAQGNVATAADGTSIADAALISELLDGLPYRSQIMSMDEQTWLGKSVSEQQEFLDVLFEKAERYQKTIAATDNWVRINAEQSDDDAVYPMQLEDLP